jgi:hypothetical protein
MTAEPFRVNRLHPLEGPRPIPLRYVRLEPKETPAMSRYNKTLAAVITGLIGWASAVVASDPTAITATEWIMLATVTASSLGVYTVANTPPAGKPRRRDISETGEVTL